jgi:sulfur transfer protein SufE
MNIPELEIYLKSLDESLELAQSQKEKLEFLVEIGKAHKSDTTLVSNHNFKVAGCASNTYICAEITDSNNLLLKSSTDSFVVSGYLAIFEKSLNNLDKNKLAEAIVILKVWLHKNGYDTGIVPTRIEASSRILEKIVEQVEER